MGEKSGRKNLGMVRDDSNCDGSLVLGLGCQAWASSPESCRKRHGSIKSELRETATEPLLTLRLSDGMYLETRSALQSPPNSVVSSSYALPSSSFKREKDAVSEEDEGERVSSRISDEEEGSARKKLRLSKEQSTLLEERFKEHSTLNPVDFFSFSISCKRTILLRLNNPFFFI